MKFVENEKAQFHGARDTYEMWFMHAKEQRERQKKKNKGHVQEKEHKETGSILADRVLLRFLPLRTLVYARVFAIDVRLCSYQWLHATF